MNELLIMLLFRVYRMKGLFLFSSMNDLDFSCPSYAYTYHIEDAINVPLDLSVPFPLLYCLSHFNPDIFLLNVFRTTSFLQSI